MPRTSTRTRQFARAELDIPHSRLIPKLDRRKSFGWVIMSPENSSDDDESASETFEAKPSGATTSSGSNDSEAETTELPDTPDAEDPMTYLPAFLRASGVFSVSGVVICLAAIIQGSLSFSTVIEAMLRFLAHVVAFAAAAVVLVRIHIWKRKLCWAHYEIVILDKPISNINLQWRPVLINLGKDIGLTVVILHYLRDVVPNCLWLFLVSMSLFLLQRFSFCGENKRRFVLMFVFPSMGLITSCYGAWGSAEVLSIGIAVLWGSLLETVTMIGILSNPAWCTRYSNEVFANASDRKSFEEQLQTIRTGDILLISGYERTSTSLRFFSGGDWSHVAMFLTNPPQAVKEKLAPSWEQNSECPVWVLESDPELTDFVKAKKIGHSGGVQLIPADTYFENLAEYYDNQHICVVRHLIIPENAHRNQPAQKPTIPDNRDETWNENFPQLENWLVKHGDANYESHVSELLRATVKLNTGNMKDSTKELFCSELVARCYMKMELLSTQILPDNYTPGDFSSHAPFNLNLRRKAALTVEQRISFNAA